MKSIHLRIENDVSALHGLRESVRAFLGSLSAHFDATEMNRVVLAVDEATANIIEHGAVPGSPLLIELEMIEEADCVRFVLRDNGTRFDPTEFPASDPEDYLSSGADGGAGLPIMRQIMEIAYEHANGENRLTLKKKRP